MTKKMISALLCVSLAAAMTAGCGKDSGGQESGSSGGGVLVSESAGVSDQLTEELKAMVPDRDYSRIYGRLLRNDAE